MLISEEVEIVLNPENIKYLEPLGVVMIKIKRK